MTFTPEEGAQIFKRDAIGRVRLAACGSLLQGLDVDRPGLGS
jgi:hypothetical protein